MMETGGDKKFCASRDFLPGDVIGTTKVEPPLAAVLQQDQKFQRCDHCFVLAANLSKCLGCRWFAYCSAACKYSDWVDAGHKQECPIYKLNHQRRNCLDFMYPEDDMLRLLLRLWLLYQAGSDCFTRVALLQDGAATTRAFMDLASNMASVKSCTVSFNYFENYLVKLWKKYHLLTSRDQEDQLLEIWARVKFNTFAVLQSDSSDPIGMALYLAGSVYNHSCVPNANPVWRQGNLLEVRAISTIYKGEEVTLNYINLLLHTEERRDRLLRGYKFLCRCLRCKTTHGSSERLHEESDALDRIKSNEKVVEVILHSPHMRTDFECLRRSVDLLSENRKLLMNRVYVPEYHPAVTMVLRGLATLIFSWASAGHLAKYGALVMDEQEWIAMAERAIQVTYGQDDTIFRRFLLDSAEYQNLCLSV